MKLVGKSEPTILVVGDFFFFLLSLWISLFLRNLEIPSRELFYTHLVPFLFLFLVWILVFYIAGLYEKHTVILQSKLPSTLLNTQAANSILAVVFFYFVPFFGITPKTILFIYLAVSFALVLLWRMYLFFYIGRRKLDNAIIIGTGEEMKELVEEVNQNPIYNIRFVSSVDLARSEDSGFWDEIVSRIYAENVCIIAIDLNHEKVDPVLPHLYNLIFSHITFIDTHKIYEDIFGRVPLSLLKYNWFLENISSSPRGVYDALKRIFDIIFSLVLMVIPIITYPFIALAIKMEDSGPIFIRQERIGLNNKIIHLWKFRSMQRSEHDKWVGEGDNQVTKVGAFLRKTRLDEFPQLLSVLLGDLSGIGPRPDIRDLGTKLAAEIPYYNVRNIIKPGLSGWAQVNQDIVPQSVAETKSRLAYDLYYVKNRSLLLDLKIGLRTIKTLLSRVGK